MEALAAALADPEGFHRLVLVRRPPDGGWSRVVGTPVTLREGVGVKLVATVGTRHETETVRPAEWADRREALLAEPFDPAHVQSPAGDVHARRRRRAGCWSRRASPRGRRMSPSPPTTGRAGGPSTWTTRRPGALPGLLRGRGTG